jgi:hypothetical protein
MPNSYCPGNRQEKTGNHSTGVPSLSFSTLLLRLLKTSSGLKILHLWNLADSLWVYG